MLFFILYFCIMLFDFQSFIDELREKDDKKEVVEKYEKFYWTITGNIKDQHRYKEYLINFKYVPFKVPDEVKDEFDWVLLMQLVAWSFSSECLFEKPQNNVKESDEKINDKESADNTNHWSIDEQEWIDEIMYDLTISVKSGDQTVVKKVEELWSFQILRLYEIYIEEQMHLQILIKEDEKEWQAIISQRQARLQRRKVMLDSLNKDELAKQSKKEQEEQLWDLYSQL